jgi:hypothetical protein
MPADDRAVRIRDVLRLADAVLATIHKLGQQRASLVPALGAQIAAVQLQDIEGVQEYMGMPPQVSLPIPTIFRDRTI